MVDPVESKMIQQHETVTATGDVDRARRWALIGIIAGQAVVYLVVGADPGSRHLPIHLGWCGRCEREQSLPIQSSANRSAAEHGRSIQSESC